MYPKEGTSIVEEINEFNEEDSDSILIATLEEGGRGVDYKDVRTLIKVGFFTNEQNIQINGRIHGSIL